jgi:hypothetical protein
MVSMTRKTTLASSISVSILLTHQSGGRATNIDLAKDTDLAGIRIPVSKLAREVTELEGNRASVAVATFTPRLASVRQDTSQKK